jgi:YfiH family protein
VIVSRERLGRVDCLLTGRTPAAPGTSSRARYGDGNLGDHVGDRPDAVIAARRELAGSAGVDADRLLFMTQVHGDRVVVADGPWQGPAPECDALVTAQPDLALAVLVADCVPVLLAAPDEGVVAVAHAGRRGVACAVVVRTLEAMRALGARSVVARVGPSVCARCYSVPEAMREEVAALAPATWSVDRHGRPALDLAAGVIEQLAAHDVAVDLVDGCTVERPDLYSYRRDGVTGRFAVVAVAPGVRAR